MSAKIPPKIILLLNQKKARKKPENKRSGIKINFLKKNATIDLNRPTNWTSKSKI